MKIAFIRKRYVSHGGAERYLHCVINELLKVGHEVHIFANRWEEADKGVIFHKVPMFGGLTFLKVLNFALFSYFILKRYTFDIVYSLEKTLYQDVYRAGDGCHKEWLLKRKAINSSIKNLIDNINPLHLTICFIEKKIFKKGNYKYIIANSYRGKEEIIRHYKVEPGKIEVIYNGVERQELNVLDKINRKKDVRIKLSLRDHEFILLFVGSGFERKGLFYVIQAIRKLLEEVKGVFVRLVVIGKGKKYKYSRFIRNYNLNNNILFLGPIKNVVDYYLAADVLVLPSVYEPFSNVCLEAMAYGLPIITSRVNGVSEIIKEGKNGYIIEDPKDFNTIFLKLKLLLNQDVRERIGKEAEETVKDLTPRKNALKTIEVFNRIL